MRKPRYEMPLSRLRDQLGQIFEQPDFALTDLVGGGWIPAVDLLDNKDKLTVKAELPGFKREELEVSVHESNLIISGERRSEEERKDGEFYRSEAVLRKVSSGYFPARAGGHWKDTSILQRQCLLLCFRRAIRRR